MSKCHILDDIQVIDVLDKLQKWTNKKQKTWTSKKIKKKIVDMQFGMPRHHQLYLNHTRSKVKLGNTSKSKQTYLVKATANMPLRMVFAARNNHEAYSGSN